MSESTPSNDVYEMFWDCPACGTTELLGKTHRHCPACGSPQDAPRRYFPADDRKVLAKDHVYAGVDLVCSNCATANGASAAFCVNCGARIGDDDARVAVKVDTQAPPQTVTPTDPAAGQRHGRGRRIAVVAAAVVLGVVALVSALTWTREAIFRVDGHHWERTIGIEVLRTVSQGAWCRSMPTDATSVTRARRQSGTRQVADGEDCQTTRIDQGDGTFRQERSCAPRYVAEAVYDDWCAFTVDRWVVARSARGSGEALQPAPHWPQAEVRTCAALGCERLGPRREDYRVVLLGDDASRRFECPLAQAQWARFAKGSAWRAEVSVVAGGIDCNTLAPAAE